MKETNYIAWFALLWFVIQIDSCMNTMQNRDIIKELRLIKQEIRK